MTAVPSPEHLHITADSLLSEFGVATFLVLCAVSVPLAVKGASSLGVQDVLLMWLDGRVWAFPTVGANALLLLTAIQIAVNIMMTPATARRHGCWQKD